MTQPPILVMGIGNPLMRDEGIGPRVVEVLKSTYDFGPRVEVVDAGTMGLMILDLLAGREQLIVVDAVRGTGHEPGTIVFFDPKDLADSQVMHSLHDMRLVDVLQNAALLDRMPAATVIGIQIEAIEQWVLELSPKVEAAIPAACAAVLSELSSLGVEPTHRLDLDADALIIEALRTYAPMPENSPASNSQPGPEETA